MMFHNTLTQNKFFLGILMTVFITMLSCKHNNKIEEYTGKIRVINASYLAGAINLDVDYEKVYDFNIVYLNYTHFRSFMEGKHQIQIKDELNNSLIDTTLTMQRDKYFSIFIYDSANTIKYLLIPEELKVSTGSNANIRFLHLSNDAPKVDVFCTPDTTARYIEFANSDYSQYAKMDHLEHQFIAINSMTRDTLCVQPNYYFKSGAYYTLCLRGNTLSNGTDSLNFFVIEDTSNYE